MGWRSRPTTKPQRYAVRAIPETCPSGEDTSYSSGTSAAPRAVGARGDRRQLHTVVNHPWVLVTLTAPSFGVVHAAPASVPR
jgi:hypothetical protein